MAVGGIIFFFFIALYIYFIPAIVGRKHNDATGKAHL
jgi:heme/copper-type cytochrome/quinol oxidase subunit 1